jgi:internalin A
MLRQMMANERVLQLIKEAYEKDLVSLYLDGYNLAEVPPEIGKLRTLKDLDISNNQLTRLPPEIGELENLTELNLYNNQLYQLPPEIGKLKNLIKLNLSGNRLTQLPPEIRELKKLKKLYSFNSQLIQLPPEIGELKNLTELELSGNQLTQLPPEIRELKKLPTLFLSSNQLTQLPQEIGKLSNLTELSISYNNLTDLPPEIGELENLETLNLSHNKLTQIPPEIGELKNLEILNLYDNRLSQLTPKIGELKNLIDLNLSGNRLTELPSEIGRLNNIKGLDLSGNPLTSPPPEIVSLGLRAVITYLKQLKQSKTTEHNEAKLILVGNGEVGKSCLAHRLIKNEFLEDSTITEGINISKWIIPAPSSNPRNSKIKLNIWDFGGQEIYHATHQFFLTTRSVYLLVWNARKTKDYENIYYWLHTIEAFGGDSPIILVMSKMNESDDDLNIKDLKSKFPQIEDSLKIDSKDGKRVQILKEKISETAWNLPLMRASWFDSWYKVREKLEGIKDYWIPYDKFYKICVLEGLDDENIHTLDGYLHELGVTLHFDERLENMVILKPEWVTGAFYSILSTKSVLQREGVLLYSELRYIWDREIYPSSIYPQLMDLMNKFELAYELPDESSYLIPELLPKSSPDFIWDGKDNLCFYYSYDYFLPPGIITRFIVRMHEDIDKKEDRLPFCWRGGAILKLENSRALVEMKPDEKRIEIRIKGDNKREALGAICNQLDHINSSIKKIKVSKQIPCNCSENCSQGYPYEFLLKAEIANIENLICYKSCKPVSVSLLLDGHTRREERLIEHDKIARQLGQPVLLNQTFSPNIITNFEAKQITRAELSTKVNTNVTVNLKIDLPQIQVDIENLRKEIKNLNPYLDSDLDKVQDNLDELSINSDQEKAAKPFNKLYRFLDNLSDPASDYNKIITGTLKGIEYAQKVGRTYNKFAQWLGMPQVPDPLIGK